MLDNQQRYVKITLLLICMSGFIGSIMAFLFVIIYLLMIREPSDENNLISSQQLIAGSSVLLAGAFYFGSVRLLRKNSSDKSKPEDHQQYL